MNYKLYKEIKLRKETQKELVSLATNDTLTKVFNRRKIENICEEEIKLALRYNTHFSIIFFDLNDFKPINDNYGHNVGDIYLKIFAKRLSKLNFENAIFMRISGDEFGVYIHGYDEVNDDWKWFDDSKVQ